MTTATLAEPTTHARPAPPNRILAIVRLHFVNPATTIVIPWMILGFIFLVNLAIWAIIFASVADEESRTNAQEGLNWSGASFYIFVYMTIVAIQAINLTFPFAQGYSVTRKDFYLGTSIAFLLLAAMYAAGLTVLSLIEDATDGWGLGGHMFTSVYFGVGEWYVRFGLFFTIFAFFFFLGAAFAAVYVRWRANGMIALWAAITLVIVALIALVTFTDSWPAVGGWFVETGVNGVILWTLVPTAISAVTGYFVLKKATPRN
ncbi:hypothetical protein GCM10027413_23760 [Conyzicola nivalis]|uniref:Uncharacterized protein n=1 Tax=Conyzicola nivalis TaxID=1477021 RepID=A0A916WEB7_9MICO|nr:ABC transporter permease [Conyzicola nivalis]GGA91604.1 hypothetical protein GCM10010979_02860 [Conyzicola nivalis]